MSVPMASSPSHPATETPAPEEEPPGMRPVARSKAARRAVMGVQADAGIGELRHVGAADDDHALRLPRDGHRIGGSGGCPSAPWNRPSSPPPRGRTGPSREKRECRRAARRRAPPCAACRRNPPRRGRAASTAMKVRLPSRRIGYRRERALHEVPREVVRPVARSWLSW